MNNNNQVKKDNDSKKIFTMVILILTIMITTTGGTYAYFAISATNSATVKGTAATVGLSLTVSEAALDSTNTGKMVPQLETALGTAMNTTNKCVDGNDNIVCKVYTITISNTSNAGVLVNGTITFGGLTNYTNLKWKRVSSTSTVGTVSAGAATALTASTTRTDLTLGKACTPGASSVNSTTTTTTNTSGNVCYAQSLGATGTGTASATYYIIVWIDETGSEQTDNGDWTATIDFVGQNGRGVTSTIR